MPCEVCGAPPLPTRGSCVFCHSPLEGPADPAGLLDYLAAKLPHAEAHRGAFGSSPVKDLRLLAAGRAYRGRLRRGGLHLEPPAEAADWVDGLLTDLSREAAGNRAVRSALTHAGWDLR
jgi:hypothetical protein